jgi:hypothetical protein
MMSSMMERMSNFTGEMFIQMDSHFGDFGGFPSFPTDGRSRSYTKTMTSSTKYDRNGQLMTERYENTAYDIKDHDGTHIAERKQAYKHSGTGLQKLAVERRVGDRSRKVVQEKYQGNEVRSDLFRNMDERDALDFDRDWQHRGQHLGFATSNALPAPLGSTYGHQTAPRPRRDEARRGEFVPDYYKQQHQPVRLSNDIQPALPARSPALQAPQRQAVRPARQVRPRPASRHSAISGG